MERRHQVGAGVWLDAILFRVAVQVLRGPVEVPLSVQTHTDQERLPSVGGGRREREEGCGVVHAQVLAADGHAGHTVYVHLDAVTVVAVNHALLADQPGFLHDDPGTGGEVGVLSGEVQREGVQLVCQDRGLHVSAAAALVAQVAGVAVLREEAALICYVQYLVDHMRRSHPPGITKSAHSVLSHSGGGEKRGGLPNSPYSNQTARWVRSRLACAKHATEGSRGVVTAREWDTIRIRLLKGDLEGVSACTARQGKGSAEFSPPTPRLTLFCEPPYYCCCRPARPGPAWGYPHPPLRGMGGWVGPRPWC